jgi:NAD(P)-dependent dehydrogenase (short-subunit alcohol dehydrogenase family)
MSKTWFVTGSARGFGRHFVEAALGRGDRVTATTRNTDPLADLASVHGDALLPLSLDVKRGDPAAAARALLKIVDADDPPLRRFGAHTYQITQQGLLRATEDLDRVGGLSNEADGS